jgi:hypothetical protein
MHARDEAYARRLGHASHRIARRPPLGDGGSGLNCTSAKLGSGKVERQCAALARFAFGSAQVFDHSLPDLGAVVGAIDAHDFHACFDQVLDQRGLFRRFARHRHHDPRPPAATRRPEDGVCVLGEQRVAGVEHDWRWLCNLARNRLIAEREERLEYRLQRGHHVRFHATQRAQAQAGQLVLQLAHVMPAHGEVVDEVVGALAHRGRHGVKLGGEFLLGGQRGAPKFIDASRGTVEPQGSGDFAFGASLGGHRERALISRGADTRCASGA